MSIRKSVKELLQFHSDGKFIQHKSADKALFTTPMVTSHEEFCGAGIDTITGYTELRDQRVSGADYSGRQVTSLRIFGSKFTECSFANTVLIDFRMWSTEMIRCSFVDSDLRGAALGGVIGEQRNRFIHVDFSGADMRRTSWVSASFEHCKFKDTNLEGVNFQGSTFDHCIFEGEVRDVIFNHHAFKEDELPPNEMIAVDFSRADLRFVGFRNLDLKKVRFPVDAKHLVFEDHRQTLEKALDHLRKEGDPIAKKLCFFLANELKWVRQPRSRGILNIEDLIVVAGETAPQRLASALA